MKRVTCLLLFIGVCCQTFTKELNLINFTNNDGLSNSSITCIHQDGSQLMWFGTWDGLNMFDGDKFTTFKHEPDNKHSISNNIVRSIIETQDGLLWVSTDYGINRFNVNNGQFSQYYLGYEHTHPYKENPYSIAYSSRDEILFCAVYKWGLAYHNSSNDKFIAINIPQISSYDIVKIEFGADNTLWVLKQDGALYKIQFTVEQDNILINKTEKVLSNIEIKQLYKKDDNSFWIYDNNGTLYVYDVEKEEINYSQKFKHLVGSASLSSIVEFNGETILAFSQKGLYSLRDNKVSLVSGVTKYNINTTYKGEQNILWIGTDGQGVVMAHSNDVNFNAVQNTDLQQFKNSPVRAFYEHTDGNMWIGSKGEGIVVWSKTKGVINRYNISDGLSNNFVYDITHGLNSDIYIGSDGLGLDVLNPQTGEIFNLKIPNTPFASIYSILVDANSNTVWLGTSGYGLIKLVLEIRNNRSVIVDSQVYVYDKENPESISSNVIYSIVRYDDNRLLIGTRGGGVNIFNYSTQAFSSYTHVINDEKSLSSNDILCLHKSNNGEVWIGTGYGLNKMYVENGSVVFRQITDKDGLPNNTIHGILEDSLKNLWLSTNNGISKFSENLGVITNYNNSRELQNNEFSDGSYYQDSDGCFYFGGISGFNYFIPSHIIKRNFCPKIRISNVKVQNKILNRDYNNNALLELEYNENFFSIDFVALDYIRNQNCEYRYILEGFNKDWVNQGVNNSAVFTNVPPGSYKFRVLSTNGDKTWYNNETVIAVRISQPWWNRWWAYIIASILVLSIAMFIYQQVKKRIRLNRALFLQRINQNQQQKIHDAKLRFFTNIAHEFCTPLTLIYAPCERLLERDLDEESNKYLRVIKSNATRMTGLITELMDFRKIETGHTVLKYEVIDIRELILCIADNFTGVNETESISFSIEIAPQHKTLSNDRDCLEKILYNLVSNAYKYTPKDGFITISVVEHDDNLEIQVKNSGEGIKREDMKIIFDRFRILDDIEQKASKGRIIRNGIGLALTQNLVSLLNGTIEVDSIIGKYTTFTVTLPYNNISELTDNISEQTDNMLEEIDNVVMTIDEIDEIDEIVEKQTLPSNTTNRSDLNKILIVDDEPEIRQLIVDLFSDDYIVIEAENGQDALNKMKYGRPNLIICDIIMPVMNGNEFIHELKQNIFTSHIPIIILTTKSNIDDQIEGYQTGVELYLSKPFHPKHIQTIVHQILRNRVSLKQYYNSIVSTGEIFEGNFISDQDNDFILKLTSLIEANIQNEDLTPAFLCQNMSITRLSLYRKLKEITELSPSGYIRIVKLKYSANLLKTTVYTVQEIMYDSGFNNKSYFYREFTKVYGMSPKEFRNS